MHSKPITAHIARMVKDLFDHFTKPFFGFRFVLVENYMGL